MNQTRRFIAGMSALFGAWMVALMVATWAAAYTNNYQILVTVNSYGEANIELIALCVVLPLYVVGLYNTLKFINEVE